MTRRQWTGAVLLGLAASVVGHYIGLAIGRAIW